MKPVSLNKKCVIFDFDGTIADTNRLHAAAFDKVFEELGVAHFSYETYMGRKTSEVFREVLRAERLSCSETEIERLVSLKQGLARGLMASQLTAYEGAAEVIERLQANGTILIVATSSSRAGVTLALNKLGLLDRFLHVVTGDDVKEAKPSPDIYRQALELACVNPEEAVVIEDSVSGAVAGMRAGIEVLIVNNDELRDQFYCTSFKKLLESLNEHDGYMPQEHLNGRDFG